MVDNTQIFTTGSFIIAIIVIFLIFMGIYVYKTYKAFEKKKIEESKLRQIITDCPDYWEKVSPNKCRNTLRVNGNCNMTVDNNTMDFDNEIFNNKKLGNKMKCRWAKDCNITWSGINNLC